MSVELKVPEVGESITEVIIGEWRKKEGEEVAKDEIIVEIETDKAVLEVPSPVSGVLSKVTVKEGTEAQVGDVIGLIEAKKSSDNKQGDQGKSQAQEQQPKAEAEEKDADKQAEPAEEKADAPSEKKGRSASIAATPAARRLLREHDLAPEDIHPTSPGGRITREDVEAFLEHHDDADQDTKPARDARREKRVAMSAIRRKIAKNLVQAQQTTALLTTFNEIDMSGVMELRKTYGEAFRERYGVKLGFMSFFVKALVDALSLFPKLNARIDGNDIVYRDYYDIGVAIGTEYGLVVPVVRNAERLSFAEIETTIADFGRRARDKKLTVDELQGGTFSVTNGGVYGSLLSTPIVNPPDSGVLGMHSIQERPVVRDGQIVIRPMMYVALTYDHRIVDGRESIQFLHRIKDVIETPTRILLEV